MLYYIIYYRYIKLVDYNVDAETYAITIDIKIDSLYSKQRFKLKKIYIFLYANKNLKVFFVLIDLQLY